MMVYQILASTIHGKIYKSNTKPINLKYQLQHEFKSLMGHILSLTLKIILIMYQKKMEKMVMIIKIFLQ